MEFDSEDTLIYINNQLVTRGVTWHCLECGIHKMSSLTFLLSKLSATIESESSLLRANENIKTK
jgi:hypothetical protein